MKSLFLSFIYVQLIFLILISSIAKCQITFEKALNGFPHYVKQSEDGTYILTGPIINQYSNTDIWLAKLNMYGEIIWETSYDLGWSEKGISVLQHPSGDYIVYGSSDEFIYYLRINQFGDTIWTRSYPIPENKNISFHRSLSGMLIESIDGNYISIGNLTIKFNSDGDTLWTRKWFGEDLQQTSDSGFMCIYDKYIFKVNSLGYKLWQKSTDFHLKAIHSIGDGLYVIAGEGYCPLYTAENAAIMKIDSTGEIIWQKTYIMAEGYMTDRAYSITNTKDTGIITCGVSYTPSRCMFLLEVNTFGDSIWSKKYRKDASAYGVHIENTSDDGYIIGCGGNPPLIIKTDENGCVNKTKILCDQEPPYCSGTNYTLSVKTESIEYHWSTDETSAEIVVSQSGEYYCQIIDINGCTRYSDTIIILPQTPLSIDPSDSVSICDGTSIILSASPGFVSYEWSNGDLSQTTEVNSSGYFLVVGIDVNGCSNTDSIYVEVINPYQNQEICLVTVDSTTNKNLIVFNKTYDKGIEAFNIYKETDQAGIYNLIGIVPFEGYSTYLDTNSIPSQISDRYKISITDTCGNESGLSIEHRTIHLTSSVGVNNEINLLWNPYEGFTYSTFNIYRGTLPDNMNLIGTAPSNTFSFTDLTPPTGQLYYVVEVVAPFPCNPARKSYTSTISNIVNNSAYGFEDIGEMFFAIYPNPFSDQTTIKFNNPSNDIYLFKVYDITGNMVFTKKTDDDHFIIKKEQLKTGIFFLEIIGDNIIKRYKLISI
ncbi:MAG: T9SS type A sorting domain-containing protein [Bacteroidales bacterium]|nr:T9SS type A sorting domain-containing protein [Bacteroidales bacterium]